jgi:hypothetical protein
MKRVLGSSGGTPFSLVLKGKPHREKLVAHLAFAFHSTPNSGTGYRRSGVRSRRVPFAAAHSATVGRS